VVGLANFLSIVNYNRSYFYAQSVAEFAEALGYENKSVVSIIAPTSRVQLEEKLVTPISSNKLKTVVKKKRKKSSTAN
jgi:membrane-bound lytic murein transglycosylase B